MADTHIYWGESHIISPFDTTLQSYSLSQEFGDRKMPFISSFEDLGFLSLEFSSMLQFQMQTQNKTICLKSEQEIINQVCEKTKR